jgi:glucose/arabinose dehydrogenase
MKPHSTTIWIAATLVFGLAVTHHAQQSAAPSEPPTTRVLDVAGGKIRVVPIATGLVHPWSLAFLPGNRILVAEQAGRLRLIRDGVLDPQPVWQATGTGTDRLHAIAVHPQFSQNRFVYLTYPKQGERGSTLAVARGRLDGATLSEVKDVFVADAWETGGNLAGRIMFGPDATLYAAVGDRDRLCCNGGEDNSLRMKAQDLGSDAGKVLRIRDDGSIPTDNPFVGRSGAKPEIFTYGHRNTYGFAFHPETGALWQAEIGPMGGDEVNILLPGRNYGWPLVSSGRNYTGTLVSDQPWWRPGMEMPRIVWVPSVSPSSIIFYTGDKFPNWKGNLFVGTLNGQQLQRIAFNQPSQAERREPLLTQLAIRVRDVAQGPDGLLYVATEKRSGGSDPDGTVLRIEPAN